MPDPRFTFKKAERLCSKKRIENLFGGPSHALSAFPVRAVYNRQDAAEAPVQLLVSVSKRHFKHAVDRNRTKRLIRESYRKHKHLLLDHVQPGTSLMLAFVWMSDSLADYATVEARIKNLLQRIVEELETTNP